MVAESVTSRKNESRSLLAVDIQGHQHRGFCIVPVMMIIIVMTIDYIYTARQIQLQKAAVRM